MREINRAPGLLLGLCIALLALILSAVAGSPGPSQASSATPTVTSPAIALAPSGTPSPTADATATVAPTAKATRSPTVAGVVASPTPEPTATPSLTVTQTVTGQVFGQSVQGKPLTAYRVGQGPIKVVLVADMTGSPESAVASLARALISHYQAHPDQVSGRVSLWIIPVLSPDATEKTVRNAHGVDVFYNADTSMDGCGNNDSSSGSTATSGTSVAGAFPFSEPEASALKAFLDDASIVVFYRGQAASPGPGTVAADTCRNHPPGARLAEVLAAGTGYTISPAPSRVAGGSFVDYLAGQGVAAAIVQLPFESDPGLEHSLSGVTAVLGAVDEIVDAEARQAGAGLVWLDEANTGVWRYPAGTFVHPIALEVISHTAYMLDTGRVLALELAQPSAPRVILAPGDQVGRLRVLEPLDLAADGRILLALDRAGDVYGYDPASGSWSLVRYDRPERDVGAYYFLALAAGAGGRYLLDTTHEQVWRFEGGQLGSSYAKVPSGHDVDLSVSGSGIYVLTRALAGPQAGLFLATRDGQVTTLKPNVEIDFPRQLVATEKELWVVDRAGSRVLTLDPSTAALRAMLRFPNRLAVSAVWAPAASPASGPLVGVEIVLAGRDALYFYGVPSRQAEVTGGVPLTGIQPNDPAFLEGIKGLTMPVLGAKLTRRDYQTPGAPRHYRLGEHEGLDFYGYAVGVPVTLTTPVRAVADGVVIRAMTDYKPLTAAQNDAYASECRKLGYTPPDVLDGYRGRQVWIQHANGLISHYAHLSSIASGVVLGASVKQGQVIGIAGNSGTPESVYSRTVEVHVHLELWTDDHFVGQYLRPIEAREWLESVLK